MLNSEVSVRHILPNTIHMTVSDMNKTLIFQATSAMETIEWASAIKLQIEEEAPLPQLQEEVETPVPEEINNQQRGDWIRGVISNDESATDESAKKKRRKKKRKQKVNESLLEEEVIIETSLADEFGGISSAPFLTDISPTTDRKNRKRKKVGKRRGSHDERAGMIVDPTKNRTYHIVNELNLW